MKSLILTITAATCLLASVLGLAFKETEMTPEEAANKKFGSVCGTKFNAFIPLKPVVGSATWTEDEGIPEAVDTLVSDTEGECKKNEKTIKDALNAMQKDWSIKCKAEKCGSGLSSNTYDRNTNCEGGEVKVTNRHNSAFFCVYQVKSGVAQPEKFSDRSGERCYVGSDPDDSKGYGGATVSIPETGANRMYYMRMHCRPNNTAHFYLDLNKLHEYEDEEKPPEVEEPPKDDEPKKGEDGG